jgi:hypothetical protein
MIIPAGGAEAPSQQASHLGEAWHGITARVLHVPWGVSLRFVFLGGGFYGGGVSLVRLVIIFPTLSLCFLADIKRFIGVGSDTSGMWVRFIFSWACGRFHGGVGVCFFFFPRSSICCLISVYLGHLCCGRRSVMVAGRCVRCQMGFGRRPAFPYYPVKVTGQGHYNRG